jgi:hypothetical protein
MCDTLSNHFPEWNILFETKPKMLSTNDATVLGVKDFLTTVLGMAFVIRSVTMGGGGSQNVQNCVTSFTDDP